MDIGSGPVPSGKCFKDTHLYCLDPSLPEYIYAGFPIHIYRENTRFVHGYSENIPFSDGFFDSVISANAIDHVDDFFQTAAEIGRVLKTGGKLRMHVHYHLKTPYEPIELNDEKSFFMVH